MGNSKLRRQLSSRLKELGYGKLYTGNKRRARKWRRSSWMRQFLEYLSYGPGDAINDCDGYNHIIKKREVYRDEDGVMRTSGQYEFTDGRMSCGCGLIEPAMSYEEIRARSVEYFKDQEETESGRSWLKKDKYYLKWKKDGTIDLRCDENGFYVQKEE